MYFFFFLILPSYLNLLVVEETNALLDKGDAQLLSRLEDGHVVLATSWGCHVLDA